MASGVEAKRALLGTIDERGHALVGKQFVGRGAVLPTRAV